MATALSALSPYAVGIAWGRSLVKVHTPQRAARVASTAPATVSASTQRWPRSSCSRTLLARNAQPRYLRQVSVRIGLVISSSRGAASVSTITKPLLRTVLERTLTQRLRRGVRPRHEAANAVTQPAVAERAPKGPCDRLGRAHVAHGGGTVALDEYAMGNQVQNLLSARP